MHASGHLSPRLPVQLDYTFMMIFTPTELRTGGAEGVGAEAPADQGLGISQIRLVHVCTCMALFTPTELRTGRAEGVLAEASAEQGLARPEHDYHVCLSQYALYRSVHAWVCLHRQSYGLAVQKGWVLRPLLNKALRDPNMIIMCVYLNTPRAGQYMHGFV